MLADSLVLCYLTKKYKSEKMNSYMYYLPVGMAVDQVLSKRKKIQNSKCVIDLGPITSSVSH
jgi:hypothetical protein